MKRPLLVSLYSKNGYFSFSACFLLVLRDSGKRDKKVIFSSCWEQLKSLLYELVRRGKR